MAEGLWMSGSGVRKLAFILAACLALVVGATSAMAQGTSEWHASAWQLWRIDVDGTNLRPLDVTPDCRAGSPDWSPDGTKIAYDTLCEPEGRYHIAVVAADGSDRKIVSGGSIPSWSPDGKLIASQRNGIQIVNADGTGAETLLARAFSLRWLPNGAGIVAALGPQFSRFDLASGQQQLYFNAPRAISHGFGISQDGRRFAFGSLNSGLFVAEIGDGTRPPKVRNVLPTGTVYHVSWAPDAQRVVFAWRPTPEDMTQIYTLDVDAGGEPKPFPGLDTSHQNVNPDWSPDGRTIVFSLPVPLTDRL
jgi:Tol biopolymer transport system component